MAKSEEALPESVATWLRGPRGHVIGGEIRSSISGATMEVENPATGEVIATVARADAQDIDTAVRIARETFDQRVWRGMQVDQRARVMWQLGDLLDRHAEEVGTIQTLENGMPISFAIRSMPIRERSRSVLRALSRPGTDRSRPSSSRRRPRWRQVAASLPSLRN
jgi:acyl-CoA reductase-like NAD-dependent aldehyde dehydrogenase